MNDKIHQAVIETRMKARIEELKAMRDKLVADANTQIAAMNAAISELEAILNPPPVEEPPQTE